jgi:hypothetical protein
MPHSQLSLPAHSYDFIVDILKAYFRIRNREITLEDMAQRSGKNKDMLSRAHPFLASIGALEGGRKKKLTAEGSELAAAITNGLEDQIQKQWKELLISSEAVQPVIEMIQMQCPLSSDELHKQIKYLLKVSESARVNTGVSTLIEILKKANIIYLKDGKLFCNIEEGGTTDKYSDTRPEFNYSDEPNSPNPPDVSDSTQSNSIGPSLHIDIQIHISADASADQIEQVFKNMAKYLYQS